MAEANQARSSGLSNAVLQIVIVILSALASAMIPLALSALNSERAKLFYDLSWSREMMTFDVPALKGKAFASSWSNLNFRSFSEQPIIGRTFAIKVAPGTDVIAISDEKSVVQVARGINAEPATVTIKTLSAGGWFVIAQKSKKQEIPDFGTPISLDDRIEFLPMKRESLRSYFSSDTRYYIIFGLFAIGLYMCISFAIRRYNFLRNYKTE